MKRILLALLLLAASPALADNVDSLSWNPVTNGFQAVTHQNGTIAVSGVPTAMTKAQATRLGYMQYLHGGTYNGGGAPTITLSAGGGTLTSVIRAVFIPYQMNDGAWRLRLSFTASVSSATRITAQFSISGTTFKNVSNWNQAVSATDTNIAMLGYTNANTGQVQITHPSATTAFYSVSGDVELDSKPTWAY